MSLFMNYSCIIIYCNRIYILLKMARTAAPYFFILFGQLPVVLITLMKLLRNSLLLDFLLPLVSLIWCITYIVEMTFAAAGLVASAIPCYLYYSNFFSVELSVSVIVDPDWQYAAVYLVVMAVCTVLLYLTNVKTCEKEFARVMERK